MSELPDNQRASREGASLSDALGVDRNYAPDELAPPIDVEKLRAFIARTLAEEEREEILGLIATFFSWHEAWAALRRQTFDETAPPD